MWRAVHLRTISVVVLVRENTPCLHNISSCCVLPNPVGCLTHLYQRHELIRLKASLLLVFVSESVRKGGLVVADVLAQLERDFRALSLVRGVVE